MADTIKTIDEKLTTIKASLSNIKTSLENKGVTPTGDITTYAPAIDSISTGVTPTGIINITENGIHDVTNYATAEVNVQGSGCVQYIPREVNTIEILEQPNQDFTFTLPSNIIGIGYAALQNIFVSCDALKLVDLSNVESIEGIGLYKAFTYCSELTSVDLSNVQSIGYAGLSYTFMGCRSLTSLSFPALNTGSFDKDTDQFDGMLSYVTNCTVHFPSNLKLVLQGWSSVTSGFGGINTTVLFDLPATT